MNYQVLKQEIQVAESLEYARLTTYLLDITPKFAVQERPLVLVCPGGGYHFTSEREAEIVAMQFNAMGYHSAVLDYSCAPAQFPTALLELSKSVAYLRAHAKEWCIDPDKIAVLGFSAGGHLAASLGGFWNTEWFARIRQESAAHATAGAAVVQATAGADATQAAAGADAAHAEVGTTATQAADCATAVATTALTAALTADQIRPNRIILAYPVITTGEHAHRESINNLLGEARCSDSAWLEKMSLEKQDLSDFPPAFIWHTSYDGSVPIENSLFLVAALAKYRKPLEYHVFPGNVHGMSLANWRTRSLERPMDTPAKKWIELVHTWLENWREA